MPLSPLSTEFAISDQIEPADLPGLAARGFRAVICNRPDGEGPGQPSFAQVAAAARAAGIEAAYLPIKPGQIGAAEAAEFAALMARLPRPLLAYCRSGARAEGLWKMAQAQTRL